jgi:hypothetical protein
LVQGHWHNRGSSSSCGGGSKGVVAEGGAHAVCIAHEATGWASPTHVLLHLLLLLLLSHLLLKALHLLLESCTPLLLLHLV